MISADNSCIFFDFHGVVSLTVEGSGSIVDYLRFQYEEFLLSDSNAESDLTIKIVNNSSPANYENCYSEGRSKFYIDNDYFFWSLYGKSVFFKGTKPLASVNTIYCEAGFNRIQLNMILELFLRLHFSKSETALLHAACFADKMGSATLIPAAKSTGKTALCINALEFGYKFLSDDRVWLKESGKVLAYPRYIVITKSNSQHFQKFQGKANIYRTHFRNIIITLTPGNRLKNIVRKIVQRLAPFRAKHYKIKDIYPEAKTLMHANLSGTALLLRENDGNGALSRIDDSTLENYISQVANLEWNYELLQAASIHDMLFLNESKWHYELQKLIEKDRSIIKNAIHDKSNYRLGVHGETENINWNNITLQIKELITN